MLLRHSTIFLCFFEIQKSRGWGENADVLDTCMKSVILCSMKNLTDLAEWHALQLHYQEIAPQHMQHWFAANPLRFKQFSLECPPLFLDYSKNRISAETMALLMQLANAVHLPDKIENLFTGQKVNSTEQRAALHTALRDKNQTPLYLDGYNIRPLIDESLAKMLAFSEQVRNQQWLGARGQPIKHIVNIGIGGSYLGPFLTTFALKSFSSTDLTCHFISDIDSLQLEQVLAQIDPATTLFIISSKSFTTLETMTNAVTIQQWLIAKIGKTNIHAHFVAVTAQKELALRFGIPEAQIFSIWDWVGGRYSIWSACALPLVLMIGQDNFAAFLEGAYQMDQHFRYTDFPNNMPVILALLGIWYINFFQAHQHAIMPYAYFLQHLRAYLQQVDMESNGKSVTHSGNPTAYATGPLLWGEQGCQAQHAVNQLLHQGSHLIPVDFILIRESIAEFKPHQDILTASCFSQAQALMQGLSYESIVAALLKKNHDPVEANLLARHQAMPGNRPSNILFLNRLTPSSLGSLLALYEHKTFVQGAIWNINSFDQWGVELGKQLLPRILADLQPEATPHQHDCSTTGLINYYKKPQKPRTISKITPLEEQV